MGRLLRAPRHPWPRQSEAREDIAEFRDAGYDSRDPAPNVEFERVPIEALLPYGLPEKYRSPEAQQEIQEFCDLFLEHKFSHGDMSSVTGCDFGKERSWGVCLQRDPPTSPSGRNQPVEVTAIPIQSQVDVPPKGTPDREPEPVQVQEFSLMKSVEDASQFGYETEIKAAESKPTAPTQSESILDTLAKWVNIAKEPATPQTQVQPEIKLKPPIRVTRNDEECSQAGFEMELQTVRSRNNLTTLPEEDQTHSSSESQSRSSTDSESESEEDLAALVPQRHRVKEPNLSTLVGLASKFLLSFWPRDNTKEKKTEPDQPPAEQPEEATSYPSEDTSKFVKFEAAEQGTTHSPQRTNEAVNPDSPPTSQQAASQPPPRTNEIPESSKENDSFRLGYMLAHVAYKKREDAAAAGVSTIPMRTKGFVMPPVDETQEVPAAEASDDFEPLPAVASNFSKTSINTTLKDVVNGFKERAGISPEVARAFLAETVKDIAGSSGIDRLALQRGYFKRIAMEARARGPSKDSTSGEGAEESSGIPDDFSHVRIPELEEIIFEGDFMKLNSWRNWEWMKDPPKEKGNESEEVEEMTMTPVESAMWSYKELVQNMDKCDSDKALDLVLDNVEDHPYFPCLRSPVATPSSTVFQRRFKDEMLKAEYYEDASVSSGFTFETGDYTATTSIDVSYMDEPGMNELEALVEYILGVQSFDEPSLASGSYTENTDASTIISGARELRRKIKKKELLESDSEKSGLTGISRWTN